MSVVAGKRRSERTCCVCRSKGDKRALGRLVCVNNDLVWDRKQRLPGRGGYVHIDAQCASKMSDMVKWERVLRLKPGTLRREQVVVVSNEFMTIAQSDLLQPMEDQG